MNVSKLVLMLCLATSAAACSSDSEVDIGDGSTSQGLSAYADSWDGYAEAFQFADGSDRVRLTLDENGEGVLRLGDSPLRPTPELGDAAPPLAQAPTDYAFSLQAVLEDGRLRFDVDDWQPYKSWCELQTPVAYSAEYPGIYSCFRRVAVEPQEDGTCKTLDSSHDIVPCNNVYVCSGFCACTEESCTASVLYPSASLQVSSSPPPTVEPSKFDGSLSASGDELTGTLLLLADTRVLVKLKRQ